MQLAEQYRPTTWDQVVGQDKVIAKIANLRKRCLAGRGYWINGASGTGKTTIAQLLAAEVAGEWATDENDAHCLTPKRIDEIERRTAGKPLDGGCWVIVVNEAHGLNRAAVRRLLTLFDRLPDYVVWIFTTTTEGQAMFEDLDDGGPLLSRCTRLQLQKQGLAPKLAKRAKEIAMAEGLDGKPESAYLRLVQEERNNMRAVLQRIEVGEMAD